VTRTRIVIVVLAVLAMIGGIGGLWWRKPDLLPLAAVSRWFEAPAQVAAPSGETRSAARTPQPAARDAEPQPQLASRSPSSAEPDRAPSSGRQVAPATSSGLAPTFDVARIEPGGTSVFAGRAAPNARITVLANGEPIASVTASSGGEWVAMSDRSFADGRYEFSVRAQGGQGVIDGRQPITIEVKTPPGAPTRVAVARSTANDASPAVEPGPAVSNRVSGLAQSQIRILENMVAAARQDLPALPDTDAVTPLPITFVYREAVLTGQGHKAAALLAEYLKLKGIRSVTLTGHADERGTEAFNLELSKQRLDVIAEALRSKGYTGKLELVPKGKSEPFGGIDRRRYTRDELYLLDRRVEFRSGK
jgi:outer membrane protein OmpA-like peptidoglycan-associated protein